MVDTYFMLLHNILLVRGHLVTLGVVADRAFGALEDVFFITFG
jgi:hypothetical protein